MGWFKGRGDRRARRQTDSPERLYFRAAFKLAASSMDDEDARRAIEERVPFDQAGIAKAVGRTKGHRSDYLFDRAFRLLSAIAAGEPVRPIDPANAELFTQERELGQMPLADAFARLAELEPRLLTLDQEPPPFPNPDTADRKERKRAARARVDALDKLDDLLGADAEKGLPILQSDISASIARQYLSVRAGTMPGNLTDSYFTAPRRIVTATVTFG